MFHFHLTLGWGGYQFQFVIPNHRKRTKSLKYF
jgi:hypothetical protein